MVFHSLIIVYLMLLSVKRYDLCRMAYKFLPVLFLLRIWGCVITYTFDLSWHLRGNFLISGLPWLFLGNYIAYKSDFLNKWSNKKLLWLIVCGAVYIVICMVFAWKVDITEVGVVVYATSLFLLAVKNPKKSINAKIEILGERYSLNIYIIHIAAHRVFDIVMNKFVGVSKTNFYMWMSPIFVVVFSILGSVFIHYFGQKIKYKSLRFYRYK